MTPTVALEAGPPATFGQHWTLAYGEPGTAASPGQQYNPSAQPALIGPGWTEQLVRLGQGARGSCSRWGSHPPGLQAIPQSLQYMVNCRNLGY
jgi:hypothetical protein